MECQKLPFFKVAGVAELVDAADSKSAFRKEVWVRVPPPVPQKTTPRFPDGVNPIEDSRGM